MNKFKRTERSTMALLPKLLEVISYYLLDSINIIIVQSYPVVYCKNTVLCGGFSFETPKAKSFGHDCLANLNNE